ncbi:MAG: adenylate/guanylate cyclase domain-containing protein [Bacteroidales bacterium]
MDLKKKLKESQEALQESIRKGKELSESVSRQQKILEEERKKANSLLMNIFPEKIAAELLAYGSVRARFYNNVSVLFADIENFSNRSSTYSPVELVGKLDDYFGAFDDIIEGFGLEKIKTIGDCYMCAGGLPEEDALNPYKVVMAGLWIQRAVDRLATEAVRKGRVPFQMRLGIHTGEVVAGVVGKKKFAYDIWGKAANLASLMVQSGEIRKVNISRDTYNAISDVFHCTFRGKILTKNKTVMSMYFVDRLRPLYAADSDGFLPNAMFFDKINMKPPQQMH